MDVLYLDNNATTRPAPEVIAAINEANASLWANPSSVHRFGQLVRQRIELARVSLANLIGCKGRELILTSGGTESNNLALRGTLAVTPSLLITTRIEHAAIRQPAEALAKQGLRVEYVPVTLDGVIAPDALRATLDRALTASPNTPIPSRVLVSLQWANNETGVLQPIERLVTVVNEFRKSRGLTNVLIHTDATQAVGKIPVDVKTLGVDLLTFSAHKFHGPKGVGGLYVRTGVRIAAQNLGGPQERDRRGGTENTTGILGAGVAADIARAFIADTARIARLAALRDRFEQAIIAELSRGEHRVDVTINSATSPESLRLWNTSNLGFAKLEAEAILLGLSERGVCASAGAACSSGSLEPSPVLLAMGIAPTVAHGSIRFSLSRDTTPAEIDAAIPLVVGVVGKLAKASAAAV